MAYAPNALNQYGTVGGTVLSYDGNGNLTGDGANALGFDAKNRLISLSNALHTASYAYDAFDRRISKTVDGVTTKFLLDGGMEIAEYDGARAGLRVSDSI